MMGALVAMEGPMQKDYASKAKRSRPFWHGLRKPGQLRKRKDAAKPSAPRSFSPGSFVAGVLCCAVAALVIDHAAAVAAWLGGADGKTDAPGVPPKAAAAPPLTYEFMERLPNEVVLTGVTPYEPGATPSEDAADRVYLLQAGSFLRREDADAMRAELLLEGMDATLSAVRRKGGGAWHRVLVGPFANRTEMRRARTKLREKDIPALQLVRSAAAHDQRG